MRGRHVWSVVLNDHSLLVALCVSLLPPPQSARGPEGQTVSTWVQYLCVFLQHVAVPSNWSLSGRAQWRLNATACPAHGGGALVRGPGLRLAVACSRLVVFGRPVWGLHVVRQQDLHGEADPLGLEDAVGVVEPQDVWGHNTETGRLYSDLAVPRGEAFRAEHRALLTDSRPLTGQGSVLGHQVGVVALAEHHLVHLRGFLPLALLSLQEHPEPDVRPLGGKLPPTRQQTNTNHV